LLEVTKIIKKYVLHIQNVMKQLSEKASLGLGVDLLKTPKEDVN
jgi:hypothetical protein